MNHTLTHATYRHKFLRQNRTHSHSMKVECNKASFILTLQRPLLPCGYSYKASMCQTGLSRHLSFLTSGHSDAQSSSTGIVDCEALTAIHTTTQMKAINETMNVKRSMTFASERHSSAVSSLCCASSSWPDIYQQHVACQLLASSRTIYTITQW